MSSLFEYSDMLNAPCEAFIVTEKNCPFPVLPHWHFFMECIYILEGTIDVEFNREQFTLRKDDCIFFPPKSIHAFYLKKGSHTRYIVLKFNIHNLGATKVQNIIQGTLAGGDAKVQFHEGDIPGFSFANAFQACLTEMNKKEIYFNLRYQSTVSGMLIEVIRHWIKHGYKIEESMLQQSDMDSIDRITEYIDRHSAEPLRVQDLATRCHMSYSHFAKSFREVYGQSCKEYIALIRISKVEEYLLFTDFDLTYISQETGFSDCSHLIKTFKRFKGITPKQYRLGKGTHLD